MISGIEIKAFASLSGCSTLAYWKQKVIGCCRHALPDFPISLGVYWIEIVVFSLPSTIVVFVLVLEFSCLSIFGLLQLSWRPSSLNLGPRRIGHRRYKAYHFLPLSVLNCSKFHCTRTAVHLLSLSLCLQNVKLLFWFQIIPTTLKLVHRKTIGWSQWCVHQSN